MLPQVAHVAFVQQAQPVVAFDPRECEPQEVVTLSYKTHWIKDRLDFCDVATGTSRFIVKGKSVLSVMFTLFDVSETPIVSYRFRDNYDLVHPVLLVFPGNSDWNGTDELLQIHLKYESSTDIPIVRAEFLDMATKQHCDLGIEGNWRTHDAYFWLERTRSGVRESVTKVYWPQTGKACNHHFDVAPNMDTRSQGGTKSQSLF